MTPAPIRISPTLAAAMLESAREALAAAERDAANHGDPFARRSAATTALILRFRIARLEAIPHTA